MEIHSQSWISRIGYLKKTGPHSAGARSATKTHCVELVGVKDTGGTYVQEFPAILESLLMEIHSQIWISRIGYLKKTGPRSAGARSATKTHCVALWCKGYWWNIRPGVPRHDGGVPLLSRRRPTRSVFIIHREN